MHDPSRATLKSPQLTEALGLRDGNQFSAIDETLTTEGGGDRHSHAR